MEGLELEYRAQHARLERILRLIDRSGDYFSYGKLLAASPCVSVTKVETIGFPVLPHQDQALVKVDERAPRDWAQKRLWMPPCGTAGKSAPAV